MRKIFLSPLLLLCASALGAQELPGEQAAKAAAMTQERLSVAGIVEEALLDGENDDNSQNVSSTMILANDPFLDQASYRFSQFYFRARGYDSRYEKTLINGVEMNEAWRGVFNYASIGALNDVTRNGDATAYTAPSTYSFGSIARTDNIDLRAGSMLRGSKATISYANRNYYARTMYTYSTGLQDNGWAVTASVGARYSHEGVIAGTFYRNIAGALSVERQWKGGKHSLSLVSYASPVQRGQQGNSFQEVYDLLGDNYYNPNWGYQNGEKRNARVVQAVDPTTILSHVWKINNRATLTTGAAFHYGRYGQTALNWYNGPDPRPDYYRNLPSWFDADPFTQDYYTRLWQSGDPSVTQIDWDELYRVNSLSRTAGDGSSIYMIEERRSDISEGALSSVFNLAISDRHKFTAGVSYKNSTSHQFKTVDDLMGGAYVLDVDKFAERDYAGDNVIISNDLNRPGRRAYEGDVFGYDFKVRMNTASLWMQGVYNLPRVEWFYAGEVSYRDMQRDGNMLNGRFPKNSYGRGEKYWFLNGSFKAGVNYKISGRHFLTANAMYRGEPPQADKVYISPRITDNVSVVPESGQVIAADVNYIVSLPRFSARVTAYRTAFYGLRERNSYYHDSERTFVNHMLTGVDKVHMGVEAGATYRINPAWSLGLAGNFGDYRYANNPDGTISYENASKPDERETVYLRNYFVAGVPQAVGTFSVNWFHNYWFVEVNVNAVGRNHVQVAPLRRIASVYELTPTHPGIDPADPALRATFEKMVTQERYKGGVTLDASVGKIIYLANRRSVNFNLSCNNLLDNRNIRTGGYEQGRLDINGADRFPSKYYYMQGLNVFLNASYRF